MTTTKKQKKEHMIQQYFAETVGKMIHKNGIQSVSVRKVADEAGYSLGTIYNHYKNLDALLWVTRSQMIQDIGDYMLTNCPEDIQNIQDVTAVFSTYIEYFVKHPTIFEFLYFHKLEKCEKEQLSLHETEGFSKRFGPLVDYITSECGKSPEQAMTLIKSIIYMVYGLLTLSASGNDDISIETIEGELDIIVKMMLE